MKKNKNEAIDVCLWMVSTDYILNFGAQAVHLISIFPLFFQHGE